MDRQPTYHIKFYRIIRHCSLLIMFTPLLVNAVENERFRLIPDHQSEYRVEKFSSTVGRVKNTLRYQKNAINYTSTAKAEGIASFFIKDDHEEISVLYWPQNAKQPLQQSYNYFGGKKYKKNQQILFKYTEPEKTNIEGTYKNKPYSFSTDKTVWARQLLPLLISNTLQTKPETKTVSFFITNKGGLHKYTYTFEAKETLNFKNKPLSVLKFKIYKKNSHRLSYAWLSKDYYYLPLKIEQYKDGELNASMFMTQFKLNK